MAKPPRERLAEEYGALVRSVASRMRSKLKLRVDLEDLEQMGMIGLLEAWDRFDEDCGVPLSTFAYYRIRGAIIDGLKDTTGVSRAQVRRLVRLQAATDAAESAGETTAGRGAKQVAGGVVGTVIFSMEVVDIAAADKDEAESRRHLRTPERIADMNERTEILREAIARLSEQDRKYVVQHYYEGRSLTDIGRDLDVSRSWACRVHSRALERLRAEMVKVAKERNDATND